MSQADKKKLAIGGIAVAVVAAGAYFFWFGSDSGTSVPEQVSAPTEAKEEPNYPVPSPKKDGAALPALEDSDSLFGDLVAQLLGADAVQSLLVKTDIARHIVVTVDNLPRKKVAERLKPIQPIAGKFKVSGVEGAQTISNDNAARYAAAVRVLDTMDTKMLADAYFRVYPLLQQAYVDLGYPNGYFNNRLVEVIDHLLATPNVQLPVRVVQPNVLYEFADPQLEALSAGQKTLIRIGPEHAAAVKKKLSDLRAIVTAKGPA